MAKRIKVKGTAPSSTRKKLVKEGNPKFIGPRTRESYYDQAYNNGPSRQPKKIRVPEATRLRREYESIEGPDLADQHSFGRGGIAKSNRLKRLLAMLMDRGLGGGQEFDQIDAF